MDDLFRYLDQHSGAVAALAAVVTVVVTFAATTVTLLLLREARLERKDRLVAAVEARPMPWEKASHHVIITIENFGPALARDVVFDLDLIEKGERLEAWHRRQVQALLPAGVRRQFLPREGNQSPTTLQELADRDMHLRLQWSWTDGRRRLLGHPHRHERDVTFPLRDVAAGYYGGGALVEHDVAHYLEQVSGHVQQLVKQLERIHGLMDGPGVRLWMDEVRSGRGERRRRRHEARIFRDEGVSTRRSVRDLATEIRAAVRSWWEDRP